MYEIFPSSLDLILIVDHFAQIIKVSINVEVLSGKGHELDVSALIDSLMYGNDRPYPVPLRVGCLEHLRSGRITTEEVLPEYS